MVRLFVGIKIEKQQKLIDLSSSLRKRLSNSTISWVDAGNFHLTLKFIGDVERYYINSICTLLTHISGEHHPFKLQYHKLGYFGTQTQPKVIWFDFMPSTELNNLQISVSRVLDKLGYEQDENKYCPHLTFARVKKMNDCNEFDSILTSQVKYADQFEVNSFQLIESTLKPEGPVYTTIAEFAI